MNAPNLAGERAHVAERWTQSVLDRNADSSLVTPDFEYVQHFGSTEGVYVGIEGMERWIETFYEIWDRAHFELESFRGAGDRLLATGRLFVVAGKTGIEVDILGTSIVRFAEDGRVMRIDAYNQADDANEAWKAVNA
jgi:hypothetical protein